MPRGTIIAIASTLAVSSGGWWLGSCKHAQDEYERGRQENIEEVLRSYAEDLRRQAGMAAVMMEHNNFEPAFIVLNRAIHAARSDAPPTEYMDGFITDIDAMLKELPDFPSDPE